MTDIENTSEGKRSDKTKAFTPRSIRIFAHPHKKGLHADVWYHDNAAVERIWNIEKAEIDAILKIIKAGRK